MPRILIALCAAAAAMPAAAEAQRAETTNSGNLERVVCRRSPAPGSRAQVRRICMTRREWNAFTARANDLLREDFLRRDGIENCSQC